MFLSRSRTSAAPARSVMAFFVVTFFLLQQLVFAMPAAAQRQGADKPSVSVDQLNIPTELFFSEYIEGSSNNKALEIYNGTGAPVDLAANGYSIQMFFNGSTTAGLTINLTGTVAAGDAYVVAQSSADPVILAQADQTNGSGWFNGDDAVTLRKVTDVVDSLGQLGVDPGTQWGSGDQSTADNTIRRMDSVCAGDTVPDDAFDPATEWDGFATNTFDGLGSHAPDCGPKGPAELFISEYIEGSSNNKAIEIYNGTGSAIDLAAGSYSLQYFFNGSTTAGLTLNLTGTVADGDVFVIAQSNADPVILAQADQTNGSGWFNGDDAITLRKGTDIIDSIGQVGFDPGTEWGTGDTSTADNTLRRKVGICAGDLIPDDAFDPATEWDGFATNTFDGLGAHTATCGGGPTPTNPSGIGAADPDTVEPGDGSLLTVTVTPGTNPTSTGLTVTGDLTNIGGSATQAFFDDGTNGDTTGGDNIFSFAATVDAGTPPGAKNLPVSIEDAQARTGNTNISLTVTAPAGPGEALPFSQNWTNTGLITTNDDWSGVPGITGYRGDGMASIGTDPQTVLQDGSATPIDVNANQTNPNTFTSGGVTEFEIADPVVAMQGSGTADAPHLVISIDTTGASNITVQYDLRDIDGSGDNSIQPVALHYRVGNTGDFTNIPGAFVADASSGPDEATQVTPVGVLLPAAAEGHPLVQLRIMTTDAVGSDEWIGVDNILVESNGTLPLSATGSASPSSVDAGTSTLLTVNVNPATNPASTGIVVLGDLTPIGGSAVQNFFDDGTNGDVTPGDNIFSWQASIPLETSSGPKTLAISVTDAEARSAKTTIGVTVIAGTNPFVHLTMGNPSNATTNVNEPTNFLMLKNGFSMSYHRDQGRPNWVAWHLDSAWLGSAPRQDDFREDPTLPAGWYRVQSTDYSGSGFDRGHHTPSADRTSTIPLNSETFLMTNMMPQAPNNNQGPWNNMEQHIRTIANAGNELYVYMGGGGIGGGGANGEATTVANGNVTVPAYTWKVMIILPNGDDDVTRVDENTRTIAVIMPNRQGIQADPWQKYLATVDQVEALTGLDFFTSVPKPIQTVIESRLDPASNTAPETIGSGTFTDLRIDAPNTMLTGDVTVNGVLTLGGSTLRTGANRIILGPGASVQRISGLVEGSVEKQFETAGAFEFPVGSDTNYTPLSASVTNVVSPSSLTVSVTDATHPQAPSEDDALSRYWTLTEAGDLTADLGFYYIQSDVPATVPNEASLILQRFDGAFTPVPTVIDPMANVATTTNVTTFSDWTMFGEPGAPVPVTVAGRVLRLDGTGINGSVVTITDDDGNVLVARTSPFGYFLFDAVLSGESYTVTVSHKQFTFSPRIVNVNDDIVDLVIQPNP